MKNKECCENCFYFSEYSVKNSDVIGLFCCNMENMRITITNEKFNMDLFEPQKPSEFYCSEWKSKGGKRISNDRNTKPTPLAGL